MGREVYRVPLDFDWPMKETWKGFLNPHYEHLSNCAACDGTGYNKVGLFLSHSWYHHMAEDMFGAFFGDNILSVWPREQYERAGWSVSVCDNIEMAQRFGFTTLTHWADKLAQEEIDAMIAEGRLRDFTHTWTRDDGWQPKENVQTPTPDELALWGAQRACDGLDHGTCVRARAKRFGVDDLKCKECDGAGEHWANEDAEAASEEWERTNPPEGDGWQMWETTSEGSPMSPVFATPEELATWLADTGGSTFGSMTADYATWLKMINAGWAPSAVMSSDTGLASGVEAVASHEKEE
jgi:hypothetical protein